MTPMGYIKVDSERMYQQWALSEMSNLTLEALIQGRSISLSEVDATFGVNFRRDHPLVARFLELESEQELR